MPDIAPVADTLPGYENVAWYSVVVPSGTPQDILAKINAEVVKAVKEPQFGEQLKNLGVDLVGNTRAEFDAFRRQEVRRMGELIKASGVDLK
jgi:tripartite-type tricarboxylate transporter receptor subunit TctC